MSYSRSAFFIIAEAVKYPPKIARIKTKMAHNTIRVLSFFLPLPPKSALATLLIALGVFLTALIVL